MLLLLCVFFFAFVEKFSTLPALSSANGAAQAVSWPALARVFLAWFPDPLTRGTMYSVLATNQNLVRLVTVRVE